MPGQPADPAHAPANPNERVNRWHRASDAIADKVAAMDDLRAYQADADMLIEAAGRLESLAMTIGLRIVDRNFAVMHALLENFGPTADRLVQLTSTVDATTLAALDASVPSQTNTSAAIADCIRTLAEVAALYGHARQ